MTAAGSSARSQLVVGGGLLIEAAAWTGYCLWATVGWRSIGAPMSYALASLMWVLAGLPMLISGVALLRRPPTIPSHVVARTCLVLTVLGNIALSLFAFLLGTMGVDLSVTTRASLLGISAVAVILAAGALSILRSGQGAEPTRRQAEAGPTGTQS